MQHSVDVWEYERASAHISMPWAHVQSTIFCLNSLERTKQWHIRKNGREREKRSGGKREKLAQHTSQVAERAQSWAGGLSQKAMYDLS